MNWTTAEWMAQLSLHDETVEQVCLDSGALCFRMSGAKTTDGQIWNRCELRFFNPRQLHLATFDVEHQVWTAAPESLSQVREICELDWEDPRVVLSGFLKESTWFQLQFETDGCEIRPA